MKWQKLDTPLPRAASVSACAGKYVRGLTAQPEPLPEPQAVNVVVLHCIRPKSQLDSEYVYASCMPDVQRFENQFLMTMGFDWKGFRLGWEWPCTLTTT
jgi:hypothetical protein